eukprot:TRINITY_DN10636_c0_g2_i1.p1 TRINITY_DN10636_c0_g2~~TRINITY_DN10636_c0_g2_i1.p1  ORF type:complete len:378 (+),score=39.18 TRINITY_DN10636_c0_g2_i1:545-1678(+)
MKIKRRELEEICTGLGKSIVSLNDNSQLTDYITTGLIVAPKVNSITCKLIGVFPDLALHFTAAKPSSRIQYPTSNTHGFLVMDHTRNQIIPLELTNPATETMNLIGVWLSAEPANQKPELLIAAILKFLFTDKAKFRASQDGANFLYVNYCASSESPKVYSFQVKPASSPWVMQVSTCEVNRLQPLKVKLTTNKTLVCGALYKLAKTVEMLEKRSKERMSEGVKVDRTPVGSCGMYNRAIAHSCSIGINKSGSLSRNDGFGNQNVDSLNNAGERSIKRSGERKRSCSLAKKIITQQQAQINALQQQILQAMNTIKEFQDKVLVGKQPVVVRQPPSIFDFNTRFKRNMENLDHLNIANNLNQPSPCFMGTYTPQSTQV